MENNQRHLTQAESEWRGRINELQALIAQVEAELVEAEAGLTEELAAVNAFEFKLRAGVRNPMRRLDELAAEIAGLRQQLRRHYQRSEAHIGDWTYEKVEEAFHEPGLDHENYRYHATIPKPPAAGRDDSQTAELKRLYRELARRFHPDLGIHESASSAADRAYRTQLMMAINAAYAAGDLERLKELAQEPDLGTLDEAAADDEQRVHFLLRELARLQRRLAEIRQEVTLLRGNKSYRLMKQAQKVEAAGRDWLSEMKAQLQEELAHRRVERDVLQQELEMQEMLAAEEGTGLQGEAFADAIFDISLDATFDPDPGLEAEWWLRRHRPDVYDDDTEAEELD